MSVQRLLTWTVLLVGTALAMPPPFEAVAADAPAPTAAQSPGDAAWSRARALADQGRHNEALAVIREALAAHPDDDGLLWLEAAVVGEAGRNAESVRLYEALLVRFPELAPRVRLDLATQRLWAGDPRGALRDLEVRLREDPSDFEARRLRALALAHADQHAAALRAYDSLRVAKPGDVDLVLDRAMVLGWMGRHREASAAYGEVLERDPKNARARLGLAQNENWAGRHRRAAALFQSLVDDGSKDPEVWKGLAYAEYWSGNPEPSRQALHHSLEMRPDDREALELATMLARDGSPTLTTGHGRSDDSDGLRVVTTTMEYRLPFGTATAISLQGRRDEVRDSFGRREPLRLGLGIEKTWSDVWSAQVSGAWYRPAEGEPAVGLGEADVTWRPVDRTRVDVGFAREPVVTRIALANGIRVNTFVTGLDWQATEQLMLTIAQRLLAYSDDNRAARRSAEVRYLAYSNPRARVSLLAAFERLDTDLDLDHGYYDPERYIEYGPGTAVEWHPRPDWTLGGEVRIGWQKEWNADLEPFENYRLNASIPLGSTLGLDLEGGRSDSNLSTESGFRRKYWAGSLTARF